MTMWWTVLKRTSNMRASYRVNVSTTEASIRINSNCGNLEGDVIHPQNKFISMLSFPPWSLA